VGNFAILWVLSTARARPYLSSSDIRYIEKIKICTRTGARHILRRDKTREILCLLKLYDIMFPLSQAHFSVTKQWLRPLCHAVCHQKQLLTKVNGPPESSK